MFKVNHLTLLISCLVFSIFHFGCNGDTEEYFTIDDFSSVQKIDTYVHINTIHPILLEQAHIDYVRLLTVNVGSTTYPRSKNNRLW